MRPTFAILTLLAVGLAGCADSSPPPAEFTDPNSFVLQAGKGAIAGLLLDDRFRPIHVTESATSEFQAEGFVLLQETGQQALTTENGEFTFVDLEPGTYTLRASISDHEVTPRKVSVEESVFAEATLTARRIAGEAGFIISNEYAAFVPCGANLLIYGTSFDCTFDQSGDSERVSFIFDYSAYDARHLVMEMQANKPDFYDIWLQTPGNEVCSGTYQILGGPDVDYLRFQLNINESAISSDTASGVDCQTKTWLNDEPLETIVYLNSLGFEESGGAVFGAGVYYGLQANFVQSAFVGEFTEDVDSYCAYCG